MDLSETGSWTYRKPAIGNRFVDLTETSLCPAPKGVVRLSEVGVPNYTFDGAGAQRQTIVLAMDIGLYS